MVGGGGNHPKSTSAQHRKSRWQPPPSSSTAVGASSSAVAGSSSTATATTTNPKPSVAKILTKPNPSPKLNKNNNPKPSPIQSKPQFPPSLTGPSPPPAYGFHMLERRTILLADGSVRSYFALPPDYQDFTPPRPALPQLDPLANRFLPPLGRGERFPMNHDGFRDGREYWAGTSIGEKRKFAANNDLNFGHHHHPNGHPIRPGIGTSSPYRREIGGGEDTRASKHMRVGGESNVVAHNKLLEVDQIALKKAFLHFVKVISENPTQRKFYLAGGKPGKLQCVACGTGRSAKDFQDMHALIMHTYYSDNSDPRVDHLGLHKALCVLMGWNYSKPPDNSKAYQFLPPNEAAANQDDLIIWPPTVIIQNTVTGKNKDGRIEGLGNKAMDSRLRGLGFESGKSKALYSKDGHLGITLVKFAGDHSGLRDAIRMSDYFEKDNCGRKGWARLQPLTLPHEDEKNPNLVKVDEKTGERKRVLYGYLGTAADLDKLDFETRKKVVIESQREYKASR
ncbi:hypothetical protein ACFE04_005168 [Oxalis oulophora]